MKISKVFVLLYGSLAIGMGGLGFLALRDGEEFDAAFGFLLCACWLVEMLRSVRELTKGTTQ